MIPKWLRELPFWSSISATVYVALFAAVMGALMALVGWWRGDVEIVGGGLIAMTPFAVILFLLWRTYVDDGYRQR